MRKFIFWFCVTTISVLWIVLLSMGGWKNLLVGIAVTTLSIIAGVIEACHEMEEKNDAEKDV